MPVITRSYHMQLSVRGALRNASWRRELRGCVRDDDGKVLTEDEIFTMLCDKLAAGEEMIPFGKGPCDNWDPKQGCLGHEETQG